MRVVVYGAGAIGGVIGGRLAEHGHDVTLLARGAHLAAIQQRGLVLLSPGGETTLPVAAAEHPSDITWTGDEVVFLAMKTQDTLDALFELVAAAPPTVAVVCAQNGVANERFALRRFEHVQAMCVMCPASHLQAGVVEQHSFPIAGLLDVGRYPSGTDATTLKVADALASSTFESIPRADVMRWKYTKLLMNLGNAVEAMCGHADGTAEITRRLRREGAAVLRAAGIDAATAEEDRERRGDRLQIAPVRGQLRGGGSSWQSLHRGAGRIETDYLNGEIVLLGRLHGVPAACNEAVRRLANEYARLRKPPGALPPAELLARLP